MFNNKCFFFFHLSPFVFSKLGAFDHALRKLGVIPKDLFNTSVTLLKLNQILGGKKLRNNYQLITTAFPRPLQSPSTLDLRSWAIDWWEDSWLPKKHPTLAFSPEALGKHASHNLPVADMIVFKKHFFFFLICLKFSFSIFLFDLQQVNLFQIKASLSFLEERILLMTAEMAVSCLSSRVRSVL